MSIKFLRFLNFCIDSFLFLVMSRLTLNLLSANSIMTDPKWFSIGFYFLYYFVNEYFFARTPAKWITKTKVVYNYPQAQKAKLIFIRTLVRLMPFDMISYVFSTNGYHDRWSNTQTVSENTQTGSTIAGNS